MIGMIASALPPGWKIYVKEHPAQFSDFASERGRWLTCYDTMLSYGVVTLVPRNIPAFELIDNAKAVACLVGSSCWEAVVRGIPALLFGEAWYKGCDGVHTVRSGEDCKEAIARIAAGERPDPDAVRAFLSVAEKYAIEAYLSDEDRVIARIDEATNVERLTSAIIRFYRELKSDSHPTSAHHAMHGLSTTVHSGEDQAALPQHRAQPELSAGQ
jgi:capsule polysaccharide export protein KpsC/LpsZ